MEIVGEVKKVQACAFDLLNSHPLKIGAIAVVSSGGFTQGKLAPRFYIVPPSDGIWDFDFTALKPNGVAIQIMSLISGVFDGDMPDWLRGVRVHGATNSVEAEVYSVLTLVE